MEAGGNRIATSQYSGPSGAATVGFTYDAAGNVTYDGGGWPIHPNPE